jgi:DNA-directed RNA polymerase subunit RPC12/RpoP
VLFVGGRTSIEPTSRKERTIFNTAGTSPAGEALTPGSMPGEGTYFCLVCGTQVALRETDPLPACARCGASRFRRDSIFSSLQEHDPPTAEFAVSAEPDPPSWLDQARTQLNAPGYHLAMRDGEKIATFALGDGWSRIGRCGTAEICLDDPSVSRRHAVVCSEEGRQPRILDDRSLNGMLVNNHRVDVAELSEGDELAIGRFRLYLLKA